MSGAEPEERIRFPILLQEWRKVTFIHWPYEPDEIAQLLPAGLEPDTWDGAAWVGLTPFVVHGSRGPKMPAIPGLSTFPETNLRTYVRGPDGRDGIWFFTLEADSAATSFAARTALGVPYRWADMSVHSTDAQTQYISRRRGDAATGHCITIHCGSRIAPADTGPQLHWLTGRWRAWTRMAGRLVTIPVEHEPWPLHEASASELDQTPTTAAGLSPPLEEPLIHASPGVEPKFGWPALAGSS